MKWVGVTLIFMLRFYVKPHPNICEFHGITFNSNKLSMICEFLFHGSVESVLKTRGFTTVEKYSIFKQTSSALWSLG